MQGSLKEIKVSFVIKNKQNSSNACRLFQLASDRISARLVCIQVLNDRKGAERQEGQRASGESGASGESFRKEQAETPEGILGQIMFANYRFTSVRCQFRCQELDTKSAVLRQGKRMLRQAVDFQASISVKFRKTGLPLLSSLLFGLLVFFI